MLGRDVIFESHDEAVAMGEWPFDYAPMDFVVIRPPLILAFDFRDPSLGLFHTRHSDGFDALDIRGVESLDRLLIFTLLAQGDQFLADLHCRHDASSSSCGGDGLSDLILMPIRWQGRSNIYLARLLRTHPAIIPPSIGRMLPVVQSDSSDTKYIAASATSSGCPRRPIG